MNAVRPRTSEIGSGSKLGIEATKKLPGEGFKRHWPPLMDRLIPEESRHHGPADGGLDCVPAPASMAPFK